MFLGVPDIFSSGHQLYMNIRNKWMSWDFDNFCILYFCGLLSFLCPHSPLRFSVPYAFLAPRPLCISPPPLCVSLYLF